MVKGQHTGNKSKDASTDEMELKQGKHKKVCNHPTPEKMKEKGPNLIKNQERETDNSELIWKVGAPGDEKEATTNTRQV